MGPTEGGTTLFSTHEIKINLFQKYLTRIYKLLKQYYCVLMDKNNFTSSYPFMHLLLFTTFFSIIGFHTFMLACDFRIHTMKMFCSFHTRYCPVYIFCRDNIYCCDGVVFVGFEQCASL